MGFFKLNFQLQTIEEENTGSLQLSCSCVIVLKNVNTIMHQTGIFSQCQGSIKSVSLGIEATLQGVSRVDPGYLQTEEGSSSQAGLESTTRMLCKSLDLRK